MALGTRRSAKLTLNLLGALAIGLLICACNEGEMASQRVTSLADTNPEGKTLIMIGQAVEPAVIRSMEDYVDGIEEVPAGFSFYLILSGDLQRTRDELATMQEFMGRYPDAALHLAVGYGPEALGNVKESLFLLAGGFDPELNALAEWLSSLNRPVLLRPLYEFDRACATYGTPDVYKPAYRYIVDSMRNAGVTNTRYVWHSTGPGVPLDKGSLTLALASVSSSLGGILQPLIELEEGLFTTNLCPISNFYPGDGYVDFFAISYWGHSLFGEGDEYALGIYEREARSMLDEARRLGLELMIAEATPAYTGTNSGEDSLRWMHNFFDLIEEYDIRIAAYIANEWVDEGGNWGSPMFGGFFPADARIHAHEDIRQFWLQRTAKERYRVPSAEEQAAILGVELQPTALPWEGQPEPFRDTLRWPNCPPPLLPGTGGWCLPLIPGI
nr:hypothetical protein [Oceanococcus sp. HetDA_MAG_MS8]